MRIDAAVLHNLFNAAYWIFISLTDVSFGCYFVTLLLSFQSNYTTIIIMLLYVYCAIGDFFCTDGGS